MQQINKPYEGLFITLEGGEGCGKTSVCDRLAGVLQERGHQVLKTREPGGTRLSEHIRALLLNPKQEFPIGGKAELLLFLAARMQHWEESILPALRAGKIVLCERFNDSTVAYQGCARGIGLEFVEKLCHLIFEVPDFTLLLDMDPIEGMHRKTKQKKETDRFEQEDMQFHNEVRRAFLYLADEYPQRIAVLDAALPLDEVIRKAIEALEPHLMVKKR
jgi:dTMP kinase